MVEPPHSVIVLDNFHFMDEAEETTITGFRSLDEAKEFARRLTRSSVEEFRGRSKDAEDHRNLWSMFGETCVVVGGDYSGSSELDFFISNPATKAEVDWLSLQPPEASTVVE